MMLYMDSGIAHAILTLEENTELKNVIVNCKTVPNNTAIKPCPLTPHAQA
jgi:hypothetical protein